jgi:hypothetical protein
MNLRTDRVDMLTIEEAQTHLQEGNVIALMQRNIKDNTAWKAEVTFFRSEEDYNTHRLSTLYFGWRSDLKLYALSVGSLDMVEFSVILDSELIPSDKDIEYCLMFARPIIGFVYAE